MPTARPFSYNTGSTITGTIQVGSLAIGIPTNGFDSTGLKWWSGPDEDLGYVIAHPTPAGNQPNQFSIPAFLGFWRSDLKTEESFIGLAEYVSNTINDPQTFTGGTQANTWLNNNGYWSSYQDVWTYDSNVFLPWPSSTAGYTVYTGGFTSIDDGYSNSSITLPTQFKLGNQSSNQLYMSTNGVFSIGGGTSWETANPFTLNGNVGDLWLQPGLVNTDGDTQNWWYQTGSGGGNKYYVKNLVYSGQYSNTTNPTSWLGNFYRDGQYQWYETRVKSNIFNNAGPYGYTVSPSTTSQVWRGDLDGTNWVYLGTGSIV